MSWEKQDKIWPVLCILLGLFVVIVTAPRSWERKSVQKVGAHWPFSSKAALPQAEPLEKTSDPLEKTQKPSSSGGPSGSSELPPPKAEASSQLPEGASASGQEGGFPQTKPLGPWAKPVRVFPSKRIAWAMELRNAFPASRGGGSISPSEGMGERNLPFEANKGLLSERNSPSSLPPEGENSSASHATGHAPPHHPLRKANEPKLHPPQRSVSEPFSPPSPPQEKPLLSVAERSEDRQGDFSRGDASASSAPVSPSASQPTTSTQLSLLPPEPHPLPSQPKEPKELPTATGETERGDSALVLPDHAKQHPEVAAEENETGVSPGRPQGQNSGRLGQAEIPPPAREKRSFGEKDEPIASQLEEKALGEAQKPADGLSGSEPSWEWPSRLGSAPASPPGPTDEVSSESGSAAAPHGSPPWMPRSLIEQLEALAEDEQVGPWAKQVLAEIYNLVPLLAQRNAQAILHLQGLTQLGRQSDRLEEQLTDQAAVRAFRQVRFGLYRRLDLWSYWLREPPQIKDLGLRDLSEADWKELAEAVRELDRLTAHSPEGRAWRRYLLLDSLQELLVRREQLSPAERRGLARRILERFTRRGLAPDQRRFLNTGPGWVVQRHLRLWAIEPAPETPEILAHVEAYEASARASDAQQLAADCQRLLFSVHPARQLLGQRLHYHYQNPNLRIVLTENLLNRLIPPRDPEYQWVSDTVLGIPVRGRSLVFTDVAVRTIPDPSRVRLALEVTGRGSSMTTAFQGPAIFYNRSDAVYIARKPMEVGTFGIRLWPAEVEVRNSTRLRGLETDFDPIPLLGAIVQEVARSQHEARRWEADREVEAKLRARAKAQIDAEADARLTSVSQRLQEQILGPMASLGLGPEMVEGKTDSQRITMRLRIGGPDQLGANTPRPWAPSDSLASFQVHESAVNNFLDRLDLAGRTFTLPELRQWVAERIHRPAFAQRTTEHDQDVCLTFAPQDPIVVRFQNGRFSVCLSLEYLRKGQHEWTNFQVRAFYRPVIEGTQTRLVRDGVVHLLGDLDFRSQIGLRGLFGKAFDKEKPLHISPEDISSDPRMRELMITQFVIEDGWVGIAIGPKQRSAPAEVARVPKPARLGPIY